MEEEVVVLSRTEQDGVVYELTVRAVASEILESGPFLAAPIVRITKSKSGTGPSARLA